jgi:hypothetical protein
MLVVCACVSVCVPVGAGTWGAAAATPAGDCCLHSTAPLFVLSGQGVKCIDLLPASLTPSLPPCLPAPWDAPHTAGLMPPTALVQTRVCWVPSPGCVGQPSGSTPLWPSHTQQHSRLPVVVAR